MLNIVLREENVVEEEDVLMRISQEVNMSSGAAVDGD